MPPSRAAQPALPSQRQQPRSGSEVETEFCPNRCHAAPDVCLPQRYPRLFLCCKELPQDLHASLVADTGWTGSNLVAEVLLLLRLASSASLTVGEGILSDGRPGQGSIRRDLQAPTQPRSRAAVIIALVRCHLRLLLGCLGHLLEPGNAAALLGGEV